MYPKRAGNKIWGNELVVPVFKESNNCKDPKYGRQYPGIVNAMQVRQIKRGQRAQIWYKLLRTCLSGFICEEIYRKESAGCLRNFSRAFAE